MPAKGSNKDTKNHSKGKNDAYTTNERVDFSVAEDGSAVSAVQPFNPYNNSASGLGEDRGSSVSASFDAERSNTAAANTNEKTPCLTAITTDELGNNLSGSFIRHQFFKDHRASGWAPTQVFVDASHADSAEAAEYSLQRASRLNQSAAKRGMSSLSSNTKAAKGSTFSADSERVGLLAKENINDDVAITAVEKEVPEKPEEHPISASTRRFLSYYFSMDTVEKRKKTLTALTLLGIMFSNSIGGGYGLENSIGSGGAFITILGVIIVPLVWAIPVAFVVAELSTSVPSNGGYLMWINVSMPAPVYFFATVSTVLLMFIDNAVFPALFADYLCQVVDCSNGLHTGMKLAVLAATCVLNLIGIEAVGWMTIVITIMSIAPFACMFLLHMFKSGGYVNWDNMSAIPPSIDWSGLVATLAWNFAGFEQAGSVAEDVKDPQQSFARAVIPLVGLAWLSYIPPIIAGVSRTHGPEDWSVWDSGYFAQVSEDIAGSGFKIFVVVGGLFSAFGLLLSSQCLSSRTLAGTGEAAAYPKAVSKMIFTYNTRFGTPHWAVLINTFFTGVCAVLLEFSALVAIDQALYGIRILLIFLACIKLRYAYPHLERPFKIPVSSDGLVALLTIPILFSTGLIIISAMVDTPTMLSFAGVVVGISIISYFYCRFYKIHGFDGKIMKVFAVEGLMGVNVGQSDDATAAREDGAGVTVEADSAAK